MKARPGKSSNCALKTASVVKPLLILLAVFLSNSEGKLNVFLEAKEVSRFLYDLNTNLFLVKDGTVAPMLKTPLLSSLIPPIEPYIKDLKFRFNATGRVQYRLSFQSSNETIMKHPTASIPLSGLVPKKTRGFRIKFPCTSQVTGETLLTINISFVDITGSKIWGPLSLVLRRHCVSDREPSILYPRVNSSQPMILPPQLCNKKCNKRHVMRRFCLNDFVIKARMENEILWNGQPHLRVRVQRTFKSSKVKISSRQLLEKRGQEITCSCGDLRPNRVYVILGKEDRRKRILYLDNFSTALEWSRNGKTYVRAYRRRSSCPERVE